MKKILGTNDAEFVQDESMRWPDGVEVKVRIFVREWVGWFGAARIIAFEDGFCC